LAWSRAGDGALAHPESRIAVANMTAASARQWSDGGINLAAARVSE